MAANTLSLCCVMAILLVNNDMPILHHLEQKEQVINIIHHKNGASITSDDGINLAAIFFPYALYLSGEHLFLQLNK